MKKLFKLLHNYRISEGMDLEEMSGKLKSIAEIMERGYSEQFEKDVEESLKK